MLFLGKTFVSCSTHEVTSMLGDKHVQAPGFGPPTQISSCHTPLAFAGGILPLGANTKLSLVSFTMIPSTVSAIFYILVCSEGQFSSRVWSGLLKSSELACLNGLLNLNFYFSRVDIHRLGGVLRITSSRFHGSIMHAILRVNGQFESSLQRIHQVLPSFTSLFPPWQAVATLVLCSLCHMHTTARNSAGPDTGESAVDQTAAHPCSPEVCILSKGGKDRQQDKSKLMR